MADTLLRQTSRRASVYGSQAQDPRSLDWLHLLDCPTFCNESLTNENLGPKEDAGLNHAGFLSCNHSMTKRAGLWSFCLRTCNLINISHVIPVSPILHMYHSGRQLTQ